MLIMVAIGMVRLHNWHLEIQETHIYLKEQCQEMIKEGENEEACQRILDSDPEFLSFFEAYPVLESVFMPLSTNNFIVMFIVIFCSCYGVCKYLKCNIISYNLMRENYSKIKNRLYISAWKPALIIPIVIAVIILLVYLYTGNFDFTTNSTGWNYNDLSNLQRFFFVYFSIIILNHI